MPEVILPGDRCVLLWCDKEAKALHQCDTHYREQKRLYPDSIQKISRVKHGYCSFMIQEYHSNGTKWGHRRCNHMIACGDYCLKHYNYVYKEQHREKVRQQDRERKRRKALESRRQEAEAGTR